MSREADAEIDALLARLAEGDRSAFTPAFQRLWPRLLAFSLAMLKSEADAADAAQQALEKVLTRATEYDARRPALPWALAITAWECRTLLRKRGRRRELPEALLPEAATESIDELLQRDLLNAAVHALGTLSNEDREALVATYWDQAASVSGATLRKRRERALARLREVFRRLYGLD